MIQRNTIQRELVLKAVNTLKCHATAEEVYGLLHKEHPSISLATVYRNLKQLAEAGEIRLVEIPGDAERFDHIKKQHYHIKCTECSKVFDVQMNIIKNLEKKIKNAEGFDITAHEIIFKGICPECRNKAACVPHKEV